jgi:bifunctional DNA-binding transcriptional regulator/antitoxin component of YhaV-PrlF toxin-antitoxin module
MTDTVKARVHYGADSLDLTIPIKIKRMYEISPGDVFEISVDESKKQLTLVYKRVYSSTA